MVVRMGAKIASNQAFGEDCRVGWSQWWTGWERKSRQLGHLGRIARLARCRGVPDGSENRVKSVIWWGLQGGDCAVLVVSGACGLRGGVLVGSRSSVVVVE